MRILVDSANACNTNCRILLRDARQFLSDAAYASFLPSGFCGQEFGVSSVLSAWIAIYAWSIRYNLNKHHEPRSMITLEQIQQTLAEVGRVMLPLRITRNDDDTFLILIDEDTQIHLEFFDSQQKLTFFADVGRPAPDHRLTTYEALLQYNFLWNKTGGVQLSLDGADGMVVQSYSWHIRHLSVPDFCTLIRNFGDKANVWKRMMRAGGISAHQPSAAGPASPTGYSLTDALRV